MIDKLRNIYADSFLKNSSYLMVTGFSGLALGFFFWVIAARYYPPRDIGIMSAVLSSISLISVMSLIGLPTALTYYLPRYFKSGYEKPNRIINSCMIIIVILSFVFSLVAVLGVDIWSPELKPIIGNVKIAVVFIAATVMTAISSIMTGAFIASRRSSFHMIKENAFSLAKILFLVELSSFGMVGILMSWSIGLAVIMVIGLFLLFKSWKYTPRLMFDPIIKNMAGFSIGNYVAGIFYNAPKFVFPVMIVNLISAERAGYFFIAMSMSTLLYGIPMSITGPFLTESSDKDRFWNNVSKAVKYNIGLLIPGLLLFVIFGKFVLGIFSPDYAENSFMTLIILSSAGIPMSLIMIYNIIQTAQQRVMTMVKINIVVAVMTIALSIPFMKMWDIEGAAMAYLVANGIMAIVIMSKIRNPIESTLNILNGDKYVIANEGNTDDVTGGD